MFSHVFTGSDPDFCLENIITVHNWLLTVLNLCIDLTPVLLTQACASFCTLLQVTGNIESISYNVCWDYIEHDFLKSVTV